MLTATEDLDQASLQREPGQVGAAPASGLAADAVQRGRNAVHARGHAHHGHRDAQALQRRELLRQASSDDLVDPLRYLNVLQPVIAQVT